VRVVVIPGLGGHPAFHRTFVKPLAEKYEILTAPHGDFMSEPFRSLGEHSAYWTSIVEGAGDGIVLIGISFGANLALTLPPTLLARARAVILVSWWPLAGVERVGLAALNALPRRAIDWLLGNVLFRFSDAVMDRDALETLRQHLYDALPAVRHRLVGRLLCLRTQTYAQHPGVPLSMIYGKDELALLLCRLYRPALWSGSRQVTIMGGHSISLKPSGLADVVLAHLNDIGKS
jgi:pimeloyl-ACP methyl ester carboxylesterase